MKPKVVFCIFLGHKWIPAPDSYEAVPVLICTRCGRHESRPAEIRTIEGVGRGRHVR
jgi:hypothetical protein